MLGVLGPLELGFRDNILVVGETPRLMVLGAQLWLLSAIFDLRRLAARTGREHGNDVVCPLLCRVLLTREINERYSLAFVVSSVIW